MDAARVNFEAYSGPSTSPELLQGKLESVEASSLVLVVGAHEKPVVEVFDV